MFIDLKLPPEKTSLVSFKSSLKESTTDHYRSIAVAVIISGFLLLGALLFFPALRPHVPHSGILIRPFQNLFQDTLFPLELLSDDEIILPPRWITERLQRRLPQCIIIGVRKSGTRALLEFLSLHPNIKKASDEVHFFDEEQKYSRGLQWYRSQMPYSFPEQVTVEKSPAYFITRYVPQRIKAVNSSIALILVVRNPVTRLISDYTQTRDNRLKKGKPVRTFEETVLAKDGDVNIGYKPIRVSLYHRHLRHWLNVFPREQLLIVDGDMLVENPMKELSNVESFLRLDHRINGSHFHFNQTKGFYCIRDGLNPQSDRCLSKTKGRAHPFVNEDVLQKLNDFFRPHNELFYEMIGQRFDW
ncbi:hypothetical protein RvY_10940 [Ramazzottius varieornatus]|uniref:Sulfotransferase domain-containing protein n=1 Tax=Ramazzottius varieornatus TaxID=947166 RepID=A0A1D1VGW1_RAMVA|nr:hypothetical protein RvY_10940 [Ramazzottius varieornatus]